MVWAMSHDDKNGTHARALLKGLGKKVADLPRIEQQAAQQEPPKVYHFVDGYISQDTSV